MRKGSRLGRRLYQWGSRWSGGAFGEAKQETFHGVDHTARYRDFPRCREPLRMALLLVFLVIFTVWIILDLVTNDGFAPGIRDGSTVTTKLVTNLDDVDAKPSGGVCFCPCSFDKNPTLAPQAMWDLDPAAKPPAAGSWTCSKSLAPPPDSEAFRYLSWYNDFMFLRPLLAPNSEFLLDQQGWAAARYQQTLEASQVQLTILKQDLRIREDLTAQQKNAIHDALKNSQVGVCATYALHLGVDDLNSVLVTYNERTQEKTRYNCTAGEFQRTHFRLQEFCQPNPEEQPVLCSSVYPQAPDSLAAAYQAYKQHCNPVMCNCITQKTRYETFIAVTAMLGGVYSVCTIVMYLAWLFIRIWFDGEGYESFRSNTIKQQQQQQHQQQGHLSLQLSEFPPDPEAPRFSPSGEVPYYCHQGRHNHHDSCFVSSQLVPGSDSCGSQLGRAGSSGGAVPPVVVGRGASSAFDIHRLRNGCHTVQYASDSHPEDQRH